MTHEEALDQILTEIEARKALLVSSFLFIPAVSRDWRFCQATKLNPIRAIAMK